MANQHTYQLIVCWLATGWWVLLSLWGQAQAPNLPTGEVLVKELSERYAQRTKRAHQLAQQLGWPIHKNYSNGQRFSLQDVDSLGHPIYYRTHNTHASLLTQTAALYSKGTAGLALSGSSPLLAGRLGMWDGGRALAQHREFGGNNARVQYMNQQGELSDHTTHLAGTLIAQGINPAAKGMAFGATLKIWDYNDDITEMASAAKDLLLSNHAYGPVVGWVYNPDRPGNDANGKWEWWGNTAMSATEEYLFGFYNAKAADIDRIAYSNPYYLVVRSADNKRAETGPPANTAYFLRNTDEKSTLPRLRNDGYDVIAAEATAKNVLTVGAADVSTDLSRITVSSYSGWGPTDDGRIKPDLLGVGTPILSTLSSGTASYGSLLGTSMASATVTGALLLLQELYAQLKPGQFMRSATLRALALHTATRPRPAGQTALPPPDYRQGWGLLNAYEAAQVILNHTGAHQLQEASLRQGTTYLQSVVAQGNEPLVVTIAWTDPESTPTALNPRYVNSRVPKLINDLDVRVTDDKGLTANPWTLNPNRPEQVAIPGDNIRDNVEQVVIQDPVPGRTYTIRVSHKGDLRYGAQPFSVVVSGLRRIECPLQVSLSPNADTTLCPGRPLLLSAGQAQFVNSKTLATAVRYEWLRNGIPVADANSASYVVANPGSYAVRVTDRNGCSGTSRPILVQALADRTLLTPTVSQLLCSARPSVQLMATGEPGATYEWFRDGQVISRGTAMRYQASVPGSYAVKMSLNGCSVQSPTTVVESATKPLTEILPTDSDIILPRGSSVRLQVPANSDYTYQWFRDDAPIAQATGASWLVNQPGLYRLRISQQSCTALLNPRTVRSSLAQADSLFSTVPADSMLLVMPNPASEQVTVQYNRKTSEHPIALVYSLNGLLLMPETPLTFRDGLYEATIPVRSFPPGHYMIQVIDGPRVRATRFVKR